MKKKVILVASVLFIATAIRAFGDYTATQGAGTTVVAFDATHSGTSRCAAATTQCTAMALINSAGTEIMTSANPGQVGAPAAAMADGWDATQGAKADAVASTDTGTFSLIALIKRLNQSITSLIAAAQAAIPSGANRIGYTSDDLCTQLAKTPFTFSTTSGTVQIVAPSGSTQVYICSLTIFGDTPGVKVNVVGGTGAACATGTPVAAMGSTTAANGMSFAANGGLAFGNGGATVTRTTTAGHGLCVIQSGTTLLAGGGTYVQQ